MEEDDGHTIRVAALLDMERVEAIHRDPSDIKGFDGRIEIAGRHYSGRSSCSSAAFWRSR